MKTIVRLLLFLGALPYLASAATVPYAVQGLGGDLFRIRYDVSAINFLADQELEIDFDAAVYRSLTNAVGPADFDVLLLQPNNPPGAAGLLSALALVDLTARPGVFSVDVRTIDSRLPHGQQFAINQLDKHGLIVSTIATGETSLLPQDTPVTSPEPATFAIVGTAILVACASLARRRLAVRRANT